MNEEYERSSNPEVEQEKVTIHLQRPDRDYEFSSDRLAYVGKFRFDGKDQRIEVFVDKETIPNSKAYMTKVTIVPGYQENPPFGLFCFQFYSDPNSGKGPNSMFICRGVAAVFHIMTNAYCESVDVFYESEEE